VSGTPEWTEALCCLCPPCSPALREHPMQTAAPRRALLTHRAAPVSLRPLAADFIHAEGDPAAAPGPAAPRRAAQRTVAPDSCALTRLPLNQPRQFPASARNVPAPEPSTSLKRSVLAVLPGFSNGFCYSFNHPNICWKDNTAGHLKSKRFLECADYNFFQVVQEPTRKGAMLSSPTRRGWSVT